MLKRHSKSLFELSENEKESSENIKRRKIISIITFVVIVLASIVIAWFVGRPMIELVSEPHGFRKWVDKHGFSGQLIFICMQIFQVVIAIIPGEPLELGAGYAFGSVKGTILCVIGNLIGGIIVFAVVRLWGVKFAELFFSREKLLSLKFLKNKNKINVIIYILFLLPGTPKDLLSYFVGFIDISWSKWIIITSVARLPSILTSTICGSTLSKGDYKSAVIVFAISAALSGLGLFVYNLISKHHNRST